MADFDNFVTGLTNKSSLAGTEEVYINDGGTSKKAPASAFGGVGSSSDTELLYNNAGAVDGAILTQGTNTISQVNSTNAQSYLIYNTDDGGTNYERGFVRWSSNLLEIGTEAGGTGTLRGIIIPLTQNGNLLTLGNTTNGITFGVDEDGALLIRRWNSASFGVSIGSRGGGGTPGIFVGANDLFGFSSAEQPDGDSTMDVAFFRPAAGTVAINDAASGVGTLKHTPTAIASLPGTPVAGMVRAVNDANAPSLGATVASGGSAYALVWYNNANWTVIGV